MAGDANCFGGGARCDTECFLPSWEIVWSGCPWFGCRLAGVEGLWEHMVSVGVWDARPRSCLKFKNERLWYVCNAVTT